MDVEDAPREARDEAGREDAHEAGEDDEVGLRSASIAAPSAASNASRRGERLVVDHLRRESLRARPLEARRAGAVGDDRLHLRGRCAPRRSSCMLLPRPEMRMTADFMSLDDTVCGPPARARRSMPISKASHALRGERVDRGLRPPPAATTTTMPMPQLKVRCISASSTLPCFCSQPEDRRAAASARGRGAPRAPRRARAGCSR